MNSIPVTENVIRLTLLRFVNAYLVGEPDGFLSIAYRALVCASGERLLKGKNAQATPGGISIAR